MRAMRSAGTLQAAGQSTHSLRQGKADRERSVGEVQQFARVELPGPGSGRGDQLPPGSVDAGAAAGTLPSGNDSCRERRRTGAQVALFPASAAVVTHPGTTRTPSGYTGRIQPCDASRIVETGSSSTSRTAAIRSTFDEHPIPECQRGGFRQRRRFSGAATPCPTLQRRPRSARIGYALCTWHPSDRSDEPGYRCGDAHSATGLWHQEQPLHRCRCVAPAHSAGVECTTRLAGRRR